MAISFEDSLRLNVSSIVDFKNKTPSQTQIPSVLNKNTIKVAYSEGSDNWAQVSDKGYEFYEDYTDNNYCIIDIDKSVTLTPSQINITQEANSQYIPFMMPRYYDGFDLSSTKLQIYYVNRLGEYGIDHPVNVYYNDEKIKFAWLVDNNATSVDGKLSFEIQAVGTNSKSEPYTWKSKINNDMNILKSLSGSRMVEPSNDWQEEFLSVINGKLTLATDAANDAVSAITTVESLVANAEAAAESASAIADNIMDTIHDDVKAAVDDALSDLDIGDYILTDADKIEIAELAAGLVEVPDVPSGGANALYVTVTKSADGVTTADKTFDEIRSAFTENRAVFCVYTDHTPIGSLALGIIKHVVLPLFACNETTCVFFSSVITSIEGENVTFQSIVVIDPSFVTADISIMEYVTKDDIPDGGISVTGATVGQTVKISEVDENGVPTAWEPTDFSSKSAYDYAQEAGYTGTEEEFAKKLAGESSGVHVGPDAPTDSNVNIWVDTNEDAKNTHSLIIGNSSYDGSTDVDMTEVINALINSKLGVIENGSY